MINSCHTQTHKGFTVVEALVALGVLVLAISGGFAAVSLSLNRASLSKEQVTAFYLAQEAMELVRYQRDSNNLAGSDWLSGLAENASDPCGAQKICRVDGPTLAWTACGASWGTCPVLKKSGTTHLYNYTNGDNTIFRREVQITQPYSVNSDDIINVEVRVSWDRPGGTEQFVANGIFYNWH